MVIITLPKNIKTVDDVVILARRDYERFILAERKLKGENIFIPSAKDLAVLARGRKNFVAGNYRQV